MQRRFFLIVAVSAVFVIVSAFALFAEGQAEEPADYPSEDITVVIPHASGGGTDLTTRALANAIEDLVDVSVIPENREGAGGAVGMTYLAGAEPDGYTVGVPTVEIAMLSHMGRADVTVDDFEPVGLVTNIPAVVAVHADSEFETFDDLIGYAEENPGELSVGNSGTGAIWHFVALGIEDATGVEFNHVPYDGGSPAATALLGQEIDLVTIGQSEVFPYYESDDFRALAVTSEEGLDNYPDTPTLQELGVDIPALGGWQGWAFPEGTDPEIVNRFSELMAEAIESDSFQSYLAENNLSNDFMSPEETEAFWEEQNEFFGDLVERFEMD